MKYIASCLILLFTVACEPEPHDLSDTAVTHQMGEEWATRTPSFEVKPSLECSEFYPNVVGKVVKAKVTANGFGTSYTGFAEAADNAKKTCIRKIQEKRNVTASWVHDGKSIGPGGWTCDNSSCSDPSREFCGRYWFYTPDEVGTINPVRRPSCEMVGDIFTCSVDCTISTSISYGCDQCSRGYVACKNGPDPEEPDDSLVEDELQTR